jgi:hypothetical protein
MYFKITTVLRIYDAGNRMWKRCSKISFYANKWMNDACSQISRDDIAKGGYVLYAFDVEPAFAQGDYLTLSRQGNIRIEVSFGKPLPHPVTTCIVYSEDSGYFEINLARDIILE